MWTSTGCREILSSVAKWSLAQNDDKHEPQRLRALTSSTTDAVLPRKQYCFYVHSAMLLQGTWNTSSINSTDHIQYSTVYNLSTCGSLRH